MFWKAPKRAGRVDSRRLTSSFLPLFAVFEGNVKDYRIEYIQPVRTLVLVQ